MWKLFIASPKTSKLLIPAIFETLNNFWFPLFRHLFSSNSDSIENVVIDPWLTIIKVDDTLSHAIEILQHIDHMLFFHQLRDHYTFHFMQFFKNFLLFFHCFRIHFVQTDIIAIKKIHQDYSYSFLRIFEHIT